MTTKNLSFLTSSSIAHEVNSMNDILYFEAEDYAYDHLQTTSDGTALQYFSTAC